MTALVYTQAELQTSNREGRRKAIRAAAMTLFSQNGYDRTTLKDIADVVGLTHPALYYYYKSKNDLLYDTVVTTLRHLVEKVEAVPPRPPAERLKRIAKAQVMVQLEVRGFIPLTDSVLFGPLSKAGLFSDEQTEILAALQRRLTAAYRKEIEAGCKAGVFSVESVAASTFSVLGTVSYVVYWYREKGALDREQTADLVAQFCLSALSGASALGSEPPSL
ncbi:MAG: TetR/AcrR family transcriptional regulator [Pseudomonadota bacterium]